MDLEDVEALDAHLLHCSECAALARAERAVDEKIGRAMHQIDIPDGLRERVLARMVVERGDWYRRWFGHGMRVAAVAAGLLLLVWGWYLFYPAQRPPVDLVQVFDQTNIIRPGPDELFDSWKRLGTPAVAPDFFNYAFLTGHGLAELPGHPGKKVAVLDFAHRADRAGQDAFYDKLARVYILSNKQFDLRSLANPPALDPSYNYRLHIRYRPGDPFGYLVFYTGDSFDWLLSDADSNS